MEQNAFIGMLVLALPVLFGIYKSIDSRAVARTKETNQLREQQIVATHEQTLATKELSSEMKHMRGDLTNLEKRTNDLEVVVFKKDRLN